MCNKTDTGISINKSALTGKFLVLLFKYYPLVKETTVTNKSYMLINHLHMN